MAQSLRYHLWHKRDLRQSSMTITSVDPDITVQKSRGWLAGFPIGPSYKVNFSLPAPEIFDVFLRVDPGYVQIHPSTLTELLRLSRNSGRKPQNLREVRSVSEALSDELRQACREQWGVNVANNYSAQELNILALQCPEHTENLHIQSETVILEVIDKNGNTCKPGEMGRCVVTQLINHATPLIRYEYGDYAIVGDPCPCGRGLPTLTKIAGRERNLLILKNGDRLSPRLALEDLVDELPVLQYQLVQKTHEDVEIRLATSSPLSVNHERAVIAKCRSDIGQPLNFFVTYHAEIPKLANGKFEAFRCEVEVWPSPAPRWILACPASQQRHCNGPLV